MASLVKVKKSKETGAETGRSTSLNQSFSESSSQPKETPPPIVSGNSISSKSDSSSLPEKESQKRGSDGLGSLGMLGNYSSSDGDSE